MNFAVGREINVVTFKTKIMILIVKLLRMRAGIYMLFPLVGWKKVLFHGEKAGKKVFFIKIGWNFIFVTAGLYFHILFFTFRLKMRYKKTKDK